MTRDQADMLIVWLADGLTIIRTWIDAQVAPQSALQPIPGVLPKEPIAEPERKRGRPRLTPEQKAERARERKELVEARIATLAYLEENKTNHEQAPKTYNCSYCGRVLPVTVRELHEANCRAAAIGPYTHVAQPGKQGGSNLE